MVRYITECLIARCLETKKLSDGIISIENGVISGINEIVVSGNLGVGKTPTMKFDLEETETIINNMPKNMISITTKYDGNVSNGFGNSICFNNQKGGIGDVRNPTGCIDNILYEGAMTSNDKWAFTFKLRDKEVMASVLRMYANGSFKLGTTYSTSLVESPNNSLLVEGSIGIGLTSLTDKLEVSGDTRITGKLGIGTASTATTPIDILNTASGNNNETKTIMQLHTNYTSNVANGFGTKIQFNNQRAGPAVSEVNTGCIENFIYAGADTTTDFWAFRWCLRNDDTVNKIATLYANGSMNLGTTYSDTLTPGPDNGMLIEGQVGINTQTINDINTKLEVNGNIVGNDVTAVGEMFVGTQISSSSIIPSGQIHFAGNTSESGWNRGVIGSKNISTSFSPNFTELFIWKGDDENDRIRNVSGTFLVDIIDSQKSDTTYYDRTGTTERFGVGKNASWFNNKVGINMGFDAAVDNNATSKLNYPNQKEYSLLSIKQSGLIPPGNFNPASSDYKKHSAISIYNSDINSPTDYISWTMGINQLWDYTFWYNDTEKARITDEGSQTVLNFTGQHRCLNNITINPNRDLGKIVISTGKYTNLDLSIKPTLEESLPIVELASQREDKRVFGVIANKEEGLRQYIQGAFVSKFEQPDNVDRLIINSVGEGAVWVTDINGYLENGDFITTSEIPGYGMKQDSSQLLNYTIAKTTQNCNFNPNKQPKKIVKKNIIIKNIKKQDYEIIEEEKEEKIITYDKETDKYMVHIQNKIETHHNPRWNYVPLYDDNNNIVGSHRVPIYINESIEEEVIAKDENDNPIYENVVDENDNIIYEFEYDVRYVYKNGQESTLIEYTNDIQSIILGLDTKLDPKEKELIAMRSPDRNIFRCALIGVCYSM